MTRELHSGCREFKSGGANVRARARDDCDVLVVMHYSRDALQPGCMHLWLRILAARPPQTVHDCMTAHAM